MRSRSRPASSASRSPGRISELEQRAIAQRERVRPFDFHQANRLVGREHRRSRRADLGGLRPVHGLSLTAGRVLQEAVERPPRRQHSGEAPAGEPAAVQRGEEPPHVARRQPAEGASPARRPERMRVAKYAVRVCAVVRRATARTRRAARRWPAQRAERGRPAAASSSSRPDARIQTGGR